uniref:Uncharacterized protein n=1 Tax=Tanacetum cinerariifolium TaxID=118510 RepID=A0A6L2MJ67_TANCI|nr:hypothetical protein [Tanacetum cinerariifolium]
MKYESEIGRDFRVKERITDLLVNITKHVLKPKHRVITDAEKAKLLKKFNLEEKQLPRMSQKDAIAQYYGLEKGQVIEVTYNGEITGLHVTYRCIWNHTGWKLHRRQWTGTAKQLIEEVESAYDNVPNMFSIRIHHGGKFQRYPGQMYVSSRVDIFDMVDIDLFTVVALNMMVLRLGYIGKSEPMFYNYLKPLTSLGEGLYALACEEDVRCLGTLVRSFKLIEIYTGHGVTALDSYLRAPRFKATLEEITDEPGSIAANKTEKYREAGFADVAGSGVDSSGLSHDESFGVDDLNLNLNEPVNLNISQVKTQSKLPVSEEPDVGKTQEPILSEASTQKPILTEVSIQEPIMAEVSTEVPIMEEVGTQEFNVKDVVIKDYSSKDACTDDGDDLDEDLLVDEENEIVEPDVDVHLFGISMDLPFDNIGVTNLVPDDVLEEGDVDVINADGFDSDPGDDVKKLQEEKKFTTPKEAKDRVYLHSIESRRNLKLYKNDGVRIRARCDGKVPVFTMSQGTGPTGPNRGMKAGPSGSSGLTTRSKKGIIQRIYICLGALKMGFRACKRDLLGLNGAFMKGPFPGQVLVAIGLYLNNEIYPLAYALVEVETIKTVYLSAEHRYCLRRIHENMKQGWCGQAYKDLLWRAASATNVRDFEKCMLKLKRMNPKAHEWLNKIPAKHWARSYFSVRGKDKSVITLLEYTKEYCMKIIMNVQGVIDTCTGPLTLTATRIIESIKKEAHLMKVKWNEANKYQVLGSLGDQCVVNVVSMTRSCRKQELTGNHCKHVVATYWNMALNDQVAPPPKTWVGRPKKKRKRSKHEDEPFVKDGKISRKGRTITCQPCGNTRHNKATCKGQGQKATIGGNNEEASVNASRQVQEIEHAVSQDGSGGSSVDAVIGLSAAADEGGASGPGGVGVASQGSSHSRWTKRRIQTERISPQKRTPTQPASQPSSNSQVPVSEKRNADGREMGDGTNLEKITKKWSKPDKIEHKIVKNAQKPDPKTFLHSIQYKKYLENSSNAIAATNFNQEKEEPPQNSDIRLHVREGCGIKVCEEKKQKMEDTMLELLEVCRQKEFYCMHNDVDDLIESALNSKLLLINLRSQCLDKKKQEVKNIVEQPTKRGPRIAESLQNFRVKKSFTSLNNTPQISPVNAIAPVLLTEEPNYSLSMGYEHLSTISETKSDEIIKSSVEKLVPILNECEVTSDNESECDVPVCEDSSTFDVLKDQSELLSDSNNDDISSDDNAFEDIEYVEASLLDSKPVSLEEENVVYQEEK